MNALSPPRCDSLDTRSTVALWMLEGLEPWQCMQAMGYAGREATDTWDSVLFAARMKAEEMAREVVAWS